ncbi:putative RNA-binding Zn ribbon-like protein [Amycolatopsis lexingtonensis]|uniref:RNA-binding Zn ribbon-like protein n=1 Tax=Amycolatopsis lexingtonensis TaxID=218822 RepID=A0ABR9I043_9PSEU|nr:CGNR zinc finger domain-containing protein [Amycolatopsis lexingtonensis]MBE1496533.1 putative RNA-binding Zn ribbon-like protein [Amycolatopsis lexingtonensis]
MTERFRSGAGRLCLDFIRTLRYRGTPAETEELPDAAAWGAWIDQLGPFSAPVRPAAADDARAVREAIYELLTGSLRPSSRQRLNRFAALPVPAPSLAPSGGVRWQAEDPAAAMLSLLARDALELATSPEFARVRRCAGPACGALFLDTSRPGTRRWCSMEICGNHAKKSAYRAKATAQG